MSLTHGPLPARRALPAPPLKSSAALRHSLRPNATLAARTEVTGTLAVFTVVLDEPLIAFEPGQYVSIGVFTDGGLVQRPYSIVTADTGWTRIELFIRRLPDGRLSNLLWPLAPGTRVRVGPARGLFTLDWADPRPRLMVGTGTGLAPLLAMLEALAARHDQTRTVLVHGASYHAELAYRGKIDGWLGDGLALDYRATVSRPHDLRNEGWHGLTGRAEAQVARLLAESPELAAGGALAYLCGNPDMIEAVSAVLREAGFGARDVRVEQFHAPIAGGQHAPEARA